MGNIFEIILGLSLIVVIILTGTILTLAIVGILVPYAVKVIWILLLVFMAGGLCGVETD